MNQAIGVDVIEKLQSLAAPQPLMIARGDLDNATAVALPKGLTLQSIKPLLDEYRLFPERKSGTATLTDIDSFIGHVNRTKTENTVIFCDKQRSSPSLTAVYDYHLAQAKGGDARYLEHRATHAFPLSDEWKYWTKQNDNGFSQERFAEFLEERILDVADPSMASVRTAEILARLGDVKLASPNKLLALSKGLSVHVSSKVANHVKLESGETKIQFETEHQDETGAPLVIPGAFLLLVPLFRGGALYPVIVRLRYRVERGGVSWRYALYRTEEMFDAAIRESIERVAEETGLPVFSGKPEAVDDTK